MPSSAAIKAQSKQAYRQWSKQWREHAKAHSKFKMVSFAELENIGIGRAILLVANGYSLEEEIETIKKYQDKVDIMCCDKTLGHLIDHGITPQFCLVADANVSYERYMEKWKDQLGETVLLANVCANPKWTHEGEWKEIVFFVNEDVMSYEKEFMALSGCQNVIPAGTNVSNAMIVFSFQSNNNGRRNFLGYDKAILIGFDYSWDFEHYYAFDHTGGGKINYMRHMQVFNHAGEMRFTSNNLAFSADWMTKYIQTFKLPVVLGTENSILQGVKCGDLAEQMQYEFRSSDANLVKGLSVELRRAAQAVQELQNRLKVIGFNHHLSWIRSTT